MKVNYAHCTKCDFKWNSTKPIKNALYWLNEHSLQCDGELVITTKEVNEDSNRPIHTDTK